MAQQKSFWNTKPEYRAEQGAGGGSGPLSWNEIRDRSISFSKEWENECSESAEAKTFWDSFFQVFGVSRRRIASFEVPVKKSEEKGGFVDLLWKGKLIVEHKSRGKNLDKAYNQALDYFPGLQERDLPQFVLVSDFARFRLYDLDNDEKHEFELKEFYKKIELFGFIAGYESRSFDEEDPVNFDAAEKLGKLHDQLLEVGYTGHNLEVFLVRLLFCIFAEDTGIFDKDQLKEYIEQRTSLDGSDLGMHLTHIFQVLNTPVDQRQASLDEQRSKFKYVNGKIFKESLSIPSFNKKMRESFLESCALDWSKISPAIFGSLFQSIMDADERRSLGAHYTSEKNILKTIRPLFLDDLWNEFEKCRDNKDKLEIFHKKLASIKIFDPACGCGNFLVIAYRELRLLELEVLKKLLGVNPVLNISELIFLNVDQFYGIEIEEFPSQIAQVALWLTDHQMNLKASEAFGQYFMRLPLTTAPNIFNVNALEADWKDIVKPENISYIVGNPPFIGAKHLNAQQKVERARIFLRVKNVGLLDYVTCWYKKALSFMIQNPLIRTAFVSTNSITQGEQAGVLWPHLMEKEIKINFAHRTFKWDSEGRGKAAVHCVIIGFSLGASSKKWLFEYEDIAGEPQAIHVANINAYLVDGPNIVLQNINKPLCDVPKIGIGNKPIDNGNYLFTPKEKEIFLEKEPQAEPYFKRWVGAREFLNSTERWCLWLGNCPPEKLRNMPNSLERVAAVKQFRLASKSAPTRKLAETPTRFHVENIPSQNYLLFPRHSSESRKYIPFGFVSSETLSGDANLIAREAQLFHFGVLSSIMHMSWMRAVCGRIKSDYRYSVGIVYNNFPWPKEVSKANNLKIECAAEEIIEIRGRYAISSLADLYDPLTMPSDLLQAHKKLDTAVDKAYGKKIFKSEAERVGFLFNLYYQIELGE